MNIFRKILTLFYALLLFYNPGYTKNYKGAELRTKESFLYGRFQVRYKASAGAGQTSTFFTYNDVDPNQNWNEIDIEILGRYKDDVQFNTITPGRKNHVHHQFVSFNPYTDFHTYTIEWTPDYVAWFIDGKQVHKQTGEHIAALRKPQKIMMNIWNPEYSNWAGKWNDAILPRFAYYDYVSYASYTPEAGNVGTNNNFTLQWKDDFDTWDQLRWQKASHTFPGNQCDFTPDNVVFRNGMVILCLTDNSNPGFQDNNPPSVLWARAEVDKVTVQFSEELDRESAESKSNYSVTGTAVESAVLQNDKRTVELSIPGLDLSRSCSVLIHGIKDNSPAKNAMTNEKVQIILPRSLVFPVKINVGGNAFGDYLADQEWDYNVEYGYLDGQKGNAGDNQPIANTTKDMIYRSERHGLVEYKVRVPNGLYKVTLMMAENYFTGSGKRVFDITIEGEKSATGLDLFEMVGRHAAYNLVQNKVSVQDQILDIHFAADRDFALLNGLIIESILTGVKKKSQSLLNQFQLCPNYPNPFNFSTSISYFLPDNASVKLDIQSGNKRRSAIQKMLLLK